MTLHLTYWKLMLEGVIKHCLLLSVSRSRQSVCLCLSVSNCPSSSPSVLVSILQSVQSLGLFAGEGRVYSACEPNNSPSPSTSLGYGLFVVSEHVFVHKGKCVHAGLSQDLINSWNGPVLLPQTDPCMHTSLVLDEDCIFKSMMLHWVRKALMRSRKQGHQVNQVDFRR